MRKLLNKELRLSASPLAYWFIAFALMTMLPGYPILMGAFFVCFGIFQSFQSCREANDIVYSALLPIAKSDVVRAKYVFAAFIQCCGFVISAALTLVRMAFLSEAVPYAANALMGANLVFLGFVLVIYGLFNLIFIGGFFRTAYYIGKPFIFFVIATTVTVGVAESLHHIPDLEALGALGFEAMGLQLACLAGGAVLYALLTLWGLKKSIRSFEKIDL